MQSEYHTAAISKLTVSHRNKIIWNAYSHYEFLVMRIAHAVIDILVNFSAFCCKTAKLHFPKSWFLGQQFLRLASIFRRTVNICVRCVWTRPADYQIKTQSRQNILMLSIYFFFWVWYSKCTCIVLWKDESLSGDMTLCETLTFVRRSVKLHNICSKM